MNRDKLIEEIVVSMQSLSRKMLSGKYSALTKPIVNHSQFAILNIVESNDRSTIKTIAEMLEISSSAATQLVNELVSKKYLIRKTDSLDKRVTIVNLSSKAKKNLHKLRDQYIQLMKEHLSVFTDTEFKQYVTLIKKLRDR